MHVQIIELKSSGKSSKTDINGLINHFIVCLKNNGQILSESLLVQNSNDYMLYVTTPKFDSLDERFDSVYVKRDRDELGKIFTITVNKIGTNADSQEYCTCNTRNVIEMQTFADDIDSVFTCCACGKPIALYELPYLDKQDDHWCIVNWQDTYRATDTLWLNSLSDRFTGNQLVNVNSVLNKHGKEIADEISQKAAVKVYYNIFDDLTKKVKFVTINGKNKRLCPSCGKAMKYVKFCNDYERFVCDDCSLSSNLPKEI
ncbi:MAG: DUF2310 family Zn-ribbon-containing protein [Clostridia bacterium]|nr:DUF2310 family Zn-ribbon-containing protein [Clostridia bacterium]